MGLRDSSFQAAQPELVYIDHVMMYDPLGWNTDKKREKFATVAMQVPVKDSVGADVSPARDRVVMRTLPCDTDGETDAAQFTEAVTPYETTDLSGLAGLTTW